MSTRLMLMLRRISLTMAVLCGVLTTSAFGAATNGDELAFRSIADTSYVIHSYITVGVAAFTPPNEIDLDYLIVAGGGGGGYSAGGGGGAGGVLLGSKTLAPNTYPIVIGDGGAGSTDLSTRGSMGLNTTALDLTANGGGGGGTRNAGLNGGSGGGAGKRISDGTHAGGTGSQGGNGGSSTRVGSVAGNDTGGAGGGGAGGDGESLTDGNKKGGDGGDGLASDITGVVTYYGGGGGGGTDDSSIPGEGGLGGGGRGGYRHAGSGPSFPGEPNSGGGGGGGASGQATPSSDGGSGIVIVRYALDDVDSWAGGAGYYALKGDVRRVLVEDAVATRVLAHDTLAIMALGQLTLEAGASLTVAEDAVLTIAAGATMTVAAQAALGGGGVITGSLTLDSGAKFIFNPAATLTVNSGTVDLGDLSVARVAGLHSATGGVYTLIDGTATLDFNAVQNLGEALAHDLGDGRYACFRENAGSLQLVVVSMTVTPPSLTKNVLRDTVASNQTLAVISSGVGDFDYSVLVTGGAPWLGVSPGSGVLTNDSTNTLTVSYDITGLDYGQYTDTIRVFSTNWGGITQEVPVELNVLGMQVTPDVISNRVFVAHSMTNRAINVSRLGAGSFEYTIVTNQPWLSVTPSGGTATPAGSDHTVAIDSAALPPGSHTGVVSVVTLVGAGMTQEVAVTVNIMDLDRSPDTLSWTIARSEPNTNTQTFTVWNAGAGSLPMTVASSAAWLTVFPGSGSSTGPGDPLIVTAGLNGPEALTTGVHTATARVVGTDLEGNTATQEVAVSVTVWAPEAPGTVTASDGTYTDRVRVSWPGVAGAVNYQIRRGTTPDAGMATLLTTQAELVYDDMSAVAGQTYYYSVRAVNSYGYPGEYGSDTGFCQLSPPSGISATINDYEDRVNVSWTAPAGVPAGYRVWRRAPGGVPVPASGVTGLSFNDTGGVPGVRYAYTVTATNIVAHSAHGTWADGVRRLSPPAGMAATAGAHTDRVRVTWSAVEGAATYQVLRNTISHSGSAEVMISGLTPATYDDTAVTPGVTYYYWTKALTSESTSRLSGYDAGYAGMPAPTGVEATSGTYTDRIVVRWNFMPGGLSYAVWRSATPSVGNAVYVFETGTNIFYDTQITVGREYYYWVTTKKMELVSAYAGPAIGWRRSWAVGRNVYGDYDGDGRMDPAVYRESDGQWRILYSGWNYQEYTKYLGGPGWRPVPGDYDGDGRTDLAVYNESTGAWQALLSGTLVSAQLGGAGWQPVPADYNGDGITDPAVYFEVTGAWQAYLSGGGLVERTSGTVAADDSGAHFGLMEPACPQAGPSDHGSAARAWTLVAGQLGGPGYLPASADFDGDGRSDPAVYQSRRLDLGWEMGYWEVLMSGSSYARASGTFGNGGLYPVPGDYHGLQIAAPAVYRETDGRWFIGKQGMGSLVPNMVLGGPDCVPVPGDYDGDGLLDPVVYDVTTGEWLARLSGSGYALYSVRLGGWGWIPAIPLYSRSQSMAR